MNQLKLAYSPLLLKDKLLENLGMSGESQLAYDILNNKDYLEEFLEVVEILCLFQTGSKENTNTCISID